MHFESLHTFSERARLRTCPLWSLGLLSCSCSLILSCPRFLAAPFSETFGTSVSHFLLLFVVRCLRFCIGVFVLVARLYWFLVVSWFFFLHVLFSRFLAFLVFAACWPLGHASTADGAHILLNAKTSISGIWGLPT